MHPQEGNDVPQYNSVIDNQQYNNNDYSAKENDDGGTEIILF